MKRICAWCGMVLEDVGDDEGITHTICDRCNDKEQEVADAEDGLTPLIKRILEIKERIEK